MFLRLALVVVLGSAALLCPVLCVEGAVPHDASDSHSLPNEHESPCNNSCFCSTAATGQSASRTSLAAGTSIVCVTNADAAPLDPMPEFTSSAWLTVRAQPDSLADRSLPLLI